MVTETQLELDYIVHSWLIERERERKSGSSQARRTKVLTIFVKLVCGLLAPSDANFSISRSVLSSTLLSHHTKPLYCYFLLTDNTQRENYIYPYKTLQPPHCLDLAPLRPGTEQSTFLNINVKFSSPVQLVLFISKFWGDRLIHPSFFKLTSDLTPCQR